MNLGDNNTKCFYSQVRSNRKKSTIVSIKDKDGSIYDNPSHINSVMMNHFQEILATNNYRATEYPELSHVAVIGKISDEESNSLSKKVEL